MDNYVKEGSHLIRRVVALPKNGSTTYLYTLFSDNFTIFYRWLPDKTWETIDLSSSLVNITAIEEGTNVTITGSGTVADPYVINSLQTVDGSETIVQGAGDIEVTGAGTTGNPYVVDYSATIPVPTLRFVKVSLSAAQARTLFSVPIQAVAAPGVGKAIEVFTAAARLTYGTVAFDSGDDFDVACSSAGTSDSQYRLDPNFLAATTNKFQILQRKVSNNSPQIVENDPLVIRTSVADSTVGDSTIDVYITYRIIDL
jgi:hypothetical protein